MRLAITIARAETRRKHARIRQRKRSARPRALQARRAFVRPHIHHARVDDKIVNVPEPFLLAAPQVSCDARAQSVHRAADVDVVAAPEFERAKRANADDPHAGQKQNECISAAIFESVTHFGYCNPRTSQ